MKKIIPFIMALIILTGCNKADINDSDIKQATKAESSESAVTLLIKSFVENDKELFQSLYTGETLSFEGLKEKFRDTAESDYSAAFIEFDKKQQADRYTVRYTPTGENPLPGDLLIKVNKDDGYYYFTGIIPKSGF